MTARAMRKLRLPILRREPDEQAPRTKLVVFRLADGLFGVDATSVEAVIKLPPVTRVPGAPSHIYGVVSARGKAVSVVDLRSHLHLSAPEPTRLCRLLLMPHGSDELVALYADEVLRVAHLAEEELELGVGGLGVSERVMGVGRHDGMFIVLLDPRALLGG